MFARMKNPVTKQGLVTEITFDDINEKSVKVKHHRVYVSGEECLFYEEDQDFSNIIARSQEIKNFKEIEAEYQQFALHNEKNIWSEFIGL